MQERADFKSFQGWRPTAPDQRARERIRVAAHSYQKSTAPMTIDGLHMGIDSLPEWSKGVGSSSTSASCVGSNPTAVTFVG